MINKERAEIICLACGRVLGEVERRENQLRLVKSDRPVMMKMVEGRVFCCRCGGRGFIEHRMLEAS